MKLTVLSHDLSSNAVMRAHRLAQAASLFAEVRLVGPVHRTGPWPALPEESWIRSVPKRRFPEFYESFLNLTALSDGDVLVAVKPHLASFGAALVAAESRDVPVILDIDDLDVALAPRSQWSSRPSMADLSRPGSAVYLSLLTKATVAASAVTVSSSALQAQFGGTLVPHGCDTEVFDPGAIDRDSARKAFGFSGPTVLFPGTARAHKGLASLARAVAGVSGASLAVTCRPSDLAGPEWEHLPLQRIPFVSYSALPSLLCAADIIAVPQLDREPSRYQMPMKIFEAMAMAKPIVASAVSDIPQTLGTCGRIVDAGNAKQLQAAITHLLEHPHAAEALGRRARARCLSRYSIEKIGAQLSAIVRRVKP